MTFERATNAYYHNDAKLKKLLTIGCWVDGLTVGDLVGALVGLLVGALVGLSVGFFVLKMQVKVHLREINIDF
jgi:hypothetical protein